MNGLAFAKHQCIEPAREKGQPDQQQGCKRHQNPNPNCSRTADAAHQPQRDVAQLAVVARVDDDAGERHRQCVDGNARKQQRRDRRSTVAARNAAHKQGRGQAADETCGRQRPDRQRGETEEYRRHGPQRSTARDSKHARIGQRIAKQTLGQSARKRKNGTRQGRKDGARHTQRTHNRHGLRLGRDRKTRQLAKRSDDVADRQPHGPQGKCADQCEDQQGYGDERGKPPQKPASSHGRCGNAGIGLAG